MKKAFLSLLIVVNSLIFGSMQAGWHDVMHIGNISNQTPHTAIVENKENNYRIEVLPGESVEVDVHRMFAPWYWQGAEDKNFIFIDFEQGVSTAPVQGRLKVSDHGRPMVAGIKILDANNNILKKMELGRGNIYSMILTYHPEKTASNVLVDINFNLLEQPGMQKILSDITQTAEDVFKDTASTVIKDVERGIIDTTSTVAREIEKELKIDESGRVISAEVLEVPAELTDGNTIAIKSKKNNKFLIIGPGGDFAEESNWLTASFSGNPEENEAAQFEIIRVGDDNFALRSKKTGNYVQAGPMNTDFEGIVRSLESRIGVLELHKFVDGKYIKQIDNDLFGPGNSGSYWTLPHSNYHMLRAHDTYGADGWQPAPKEQAAEFEILVIEESQKQEEDDQSVAIPVEIAKKKVAKKVRTAPKKKAVKKTPGKKKTSKKKTSKKTPGKKKTGKKKTVVKQAR